VDVEISGLEAFKEAVKAMGGVETGGKGNRDSSPFRPFRKEGRLEPKHAPDDCVFNEELTRVREEAAARERRRAKRREAVCALQKWWRRALYFRKSRQFSLFPIAIKALQASQSSKITQLITAMTQAALQASKQLLSGYLNACAVIIQRRWRAYRHYSQAKKQNRLKTLLLALVQGWKCRKILTSWVLTGVKSRLLAATMGEERRLLVVELIQTFRDEYRCGKWMRKRKNTVKFPIPAPASPSSTSASTHTRHLSFVTEASSRSSPSKSPVSRLIQPKHTIKPFLKRKMRTIPPQKINWTKVKARVNCWGDITSTGKKRQIGSISPVYPRNSVEEFLAMEQITLQSDNSLPSKRIMSKSKTLSLLQRDKADKSALNLQENKQSEGETGFRSIEPHIEVQIRLNSEKS
jgi:hypothetical protein